MNKEFMEFKEFREFKTNVCKLQNPMRIIKGIRYRPELLELPVYLST